MDITKAAIEAEIEDQGTVVEIDDRFGEPALAADGSRVTITVAGVNSKRYRKAEAWQQREFRRFIGRKATDDEVLKVRSGFLARLTIAWHGFTENGGPVAFSIENLTELYEKVPYVRRKVELATGEAENFPTPASPS